MASPAESKVDESEVTSHHRHNEDDVAPTRQSSIYSLTLDEIQNAVCEPGRDFSSMNMDEFLNSIWNVEEAGFDANAGGVNLNADPAPAGPPLARRGSVSVPAPLCLKTVDEVWAEMHREEEGEGQDDVIVDRQPTMAGMTLEDFLVRAGVVRECFGPNAFPTAEEPQRLAVSAAAAAAAEAGAVVPVSGKGFQHGLGSPASFDGGTGSGRVDNGGRKRNADGRVERRLRRMIKNRESAARSRARKQAYTVDLETELNLLKEDNGRLRAEERRAHAMRKKKIADCMADHARNNAEKTARTLRRCTTSPW